VPTAGDLAILALVPSVAAVATLAILPAGIAAAWGWRAGAPGRTAVETALRTPRPPPTAVGPLDLLSRRGALGRPRRAGIELVFTWKAAALAAAVMAFPLLVRSARTAFEEVDPRLLGIARTLGRGPLDVFARITLPLAWRGILAGTLLAFARALGEFGATILVAGNIPGRRQTLALAIFQRADRGRRQAGRLIA
jgi:molybdate transport system permease protein